MENIKIFTILRTFSKPEISDFKKFIHSPYYNRSRNIMTLFDLIKKHHPDFSSNELTNNILYEKIFHKKDVKIKVINNLFTGLIKLCNLYLSNRLFLSDRLLIDKFILDQYKFRGLKKMLKLKAVKLISAASFDSEHDTTFYYYYYHFYYQLSQISEKSVNIWNNDDIHSDLSKLYNLLQNYYYHSLIKIFAKYVTSGLLKNINKKYDDKIHSILTEIYQAPEQITHPAKKIYSDIAFNILKRTPVEYFSIKNRFDEVKDKITDEDYSLGVTLLLYYFYTSADEINNDMVIEQFKHIKLLIERRVWNYIGDQFFDELFSYAVNSAIKTGEYKWAESFINNYSPLLNTFHRNVIINFNLANLYFSKARKEKFIQHNFYEIAQEYISRCKTNDIILKLNVFDLEIRILFEKEEFDLLLNGYDSYLHLLNKHVNSISHRHYTSHYNYVSYTAKAAKLTTNKNANKAFRLMKKIEKTEICINKIWILEKLQKLI